MMVRGLVKRLHCYFQTSRPNTSLFYRANCYLPMEAGRPSKGMKQSKVRQKLKDQELLSQEDASDTDSLKALLGVGGHHQELRPATVSDIEDDESEEETGLRLSSMNRARSASTPAARFVFVEAGKAVPEQSAPLLGSIKSTKGEPSTSTAFISKHRRRAFSVALTPNIEGKILSNIEVNETKKDLKNTGAIRKVQKPPPPLKISGNVAGSTKLTSPIRPLSPLLFPSQSKGRAASFQIGESGTMLSPTKSGESGIVCSNNDLRLILCDAYQLRRHSADIRREKMRTNRSLSFDSNFFRLRRSSSISMSGSLRKPVVEPPSVVFIKNPQPLQPTMESSDTILQGDQCEEEEEEEEKEKEVISPKNMIQIRVTSDSPEPGEIEEACAGSGTAELSNRRASNSSMTTHSSGESSRRHSTGSNGCKVTWDDSSIVDAAVLGSAIESYLNVVGRRLSADDAPDHQQQQQGKVMSQLSTALSESSLCSTLKSLFVK